jgi:hypothetical protein
MARGSQKKRIVYIHNETRIKKIFELDSDQEQQELNMPGHLIQLPLEIQLRVVSFLGPRDALKLAQSCKTLHSDLALSVLSPSLKIFDKLDWSAGDAEGDIIHRALRLPVNNTSVGIHSICLDCVWGDQGWGNCKGEAWIVAFPPNFSIPNGDGNGTFSGGRAVAHSRLESHARSRLRMTFSPRKGEEYHLFYKVGGGGGHRLFFLRGRMHALIYDDQSRSLSGIYRVLRQGGALKAVRFASDITCNGSHQAIAMSDAGIIATSPGLLAIRQLLRRQHSDSEEGGADVVCQRPLSPEVRAVLEECGVPVNAPSLNAMQAWLQEDVVDRIFGEQETRSHAEKTTNRSRGRMGIRERLGHVRATRWPQPLVDDDDDDDEDNPEDQLSFCSIM